MPPGTPYASFALPYPIRVDCFTCTAHLPAPYNTPALYLLTHSHTDHILGLSSKSFAARVICSPDTKEMLLRHEIHLERAKKDAGEVATRTFAHLKVEGGVLRRDLLRAVPLNTPTEFELSSTETVTITLIDANHCPGAVMFLIEGPRGTVLHTGDVRAEHWLLKSLARNPFLQPYIPDTEEDLRVLIARNSQTASLTKTLNVIYLDTACMLRGIVVPTKENAVKGLVELIALFDKDTYFFINSWTWGYEDVLKGIARAFQCQIHVDRYKHAVYTHISDPFLRTLVTRDETTTRFHACERYERCSFVNVPNFDFKNDLAPRSIEGKKVVYINPAPMGCAQWEGYRMDVRRRLAMGKDVDRLRVPLERHSPLPELLNLVSLFRPLRVVPNTLVPALGGLDWTAMNAMFKECMAPPVYDRSDPIPNEFNLSGTVHSSLLDLTDLDLADTDPAYKKPPQKWADDGSIRRRLEVLRGWLGPKEKGIVDRALGRLPNSRSEHGGLIPTTKRMNKTYMQDSDDSSDDDGSDAHARTARLLFAGDYSVGGSIKSWLSVESSIAAATAETDVQTSVLESSVQVPVSVQTHDTTLIPATTLSADQRLPTPSSSPVLRPRDVKGKGQRDRKSNNCRDHQFVAPPLLPRMRSGAPRPSPFHAFSTLLGQISRYAPITLPPFDELDEGQHLTRAQSVMLMNACTSQSTPSEDNYFSLPEILDNNSLKPLEVQNVSIQMREDHSAEFSEQGIETPRKAVFSQASSDASPSQHSQPFKSLQHNDNFRRKRRRLEELTIDVPKTGNTGTIQASSLISALVCSRRPKNPSFRVPSPDPFREQRPVNQCHRLTSMSKHPSAIMAGNLAPSRSVPLIVSPQPERSSSLRGHKGLAKSSTSVLVTPTSSRAIGSAPIPHHCFVLRDSTDLLLSSRKNLRTLAHVERRRRREIAEKLCLARPDLVDPSYAAKRARRSSRFKELPVSAMQDISSSTTGSNSGPASRFSSSEQVASTAVRNRPAKRCRELLDEDTEDVCQTMDWERNVTGALAAGREAKDVLPQLMCLSAPRRHPAWL
ncbi:hypothetical protein EDD22DRAFT_878557, partial [Suillus occidentalis]